MPDSLEHKTVEWEEIFDSPDASAFEFPYPFTDKEINSIQKLCIIKCLRPDSMIKGIIKFVSESLGESFVQPPTFDLATSFADSVKHFPLLFILPGTDPLNILTSFAETKGKGSKFRKISLGSGTGKIASSYIEKAKKEGTWVLL